MSFSSDVKIELSKLNNLKNKQDVDAELIGYLMGGNTVISKKDIKFSTENEYNINRFSKLLDNVNIHDYKIEIHNKKYTIELKSNKLIPENFDSVLIDDNIKRALIRGTFMGSGSVNNPQKKYHLEISFNNSDYANLILNLINNFNIKAKILSNKFIIYIKDGEEISKFFALIGANSAVLKFEEIRVVRDMKNNVNRLINCETANMNKTIESSVEQIADIKKLRKLGKFNMLSNNLKEIAILREKNPNATYEELGNMLSISISKSSVSNRFKKLKQELDNN